MGDETPLVGILFCDVVGSTRLYRELGDEAAHAIVCEGLGEVGRLIAGGGGRVVKTIGDEVMAVFPDAAATFDAAVAIQECARAALEARGVRYRIGFHGGPAVVAGDDLFGTTVNVAARMASLAKADQIITTGTTVALLAAPQRAMTRLLAAAHARGLSDDVTVAEVLWQRSTTQTVLVSVAGEVAVPTHTLKMLRGARRWLFDGEGEGVTLGRAAENTIVIQNERTSRRHATIERRRDRWVLVDHSTNGTFVRPVGAAEFCICREEVVLHVSGTIGLGHSLAGARGRGIDFVLNAPG